MILITAVCSAFAAMLSCESTDAVSTNRITHEKNDYSIARVDISHLPDFNDGVTTKNAIMNDTIYDKDSNPIGRFFFLYISSPNISVTKEEVSLFSDTKRVPEDTLVDVFAYPEDKKYIQLVFRVASEGLNGICEGTYKINELPSSKPSMVYSQTSVVDGYILSSALPDNSWGTKVSQPIFPNIQVDVISSGTLTIQKGVMGYDITFEGECMGGDFYSSKGTYINESHTISAHYTGIVISHDGAIIPSPSVIM